MKTVEFCNEDLVSIETGREKARFAKARASIQWLKDENLPIYWDELYRALSEGDPVTLIAQRFAKENYMNWDKVEVRNELRAKFDGISDAFGRYRFPQAWVTRNPDGSFDIDEKAVEEHVRKRHTYTLTQEQADAIDAICKGMDTLGLHVSVFTDYFAQDKDGATPIGYRIHALLNNKPSLDAIMNKDK